MSDLSSELQNSVATKSSDNGTFHIIEKDDFDNSNKNDSCDNAGCYEYFRENLNLRTELALQEAQICSGIQKIHSKLSCPVCHGSSAPFYCTECVHNGNFYHSSVKFPERFAEKRLRQLRFNQHIEALAEKAPAKVTRLRKRDALKDEIEKVKKRIELTKQVIEDEKIKLRKVHEEETDLRFLIYHRQKAHSGFLQKNDSMNVRVKQYKEKILDKRKKVRDVQVNMKVVSSDRVKKLASVIFSVKELPHQECGATPVQGIQEDEQVNEETVKGLAEALQTNYIRGKWVTSSRLCHLKNYSILSISVPELERFPYFVSPIKDFVDCANVKKVNQSVLAGLAYLSQMVNICSSLLGVHLPKRLFYRDFCDLSSEESCQNKFQNLVLKLNANIIYLCFSQGVTPECLHPMRPLANFVALLTDRNAHLGRVGCFEFPENIMDTLEEFGFADDLLPDSDYEDDWEALPSVVPDLATVAYMSPGSASFFRRASVDETASGIVTSAAASVMSMIRGIGSPLK